MIETGNTHETPTSKYLYVELLRDGLGSVEQRIKLKELGGMFIGQMDLPDDLDSGWYTLRAYTRAQKDWPAEALFHTRVLIRGVGPVPGLYETQQASGSDAPGIRVNLSSAEDGHLSVTLTDAGGNPVIGNFSLSVVKGRYADFDFQTAPAAQSVVDTNLPEGDREYSQELDFRVKSIRNRLPDRYHVAIISQDIGYYYSTDVAGDRSVKGEEGQSFRIPELDFPEGTLFTINTTGSKFLYPAMENDEAAFAAPFDYGPTYSAKDVVRDTAIVRERQEGIATLFPADDTIPASTISSERKASYYKPERTVGPFSSVFEWRQVKLRDELQKYDDMDLMAYISSKFAGLFVTSSVDGLSTGKGMYTNRSGSVTQRVTVSHGEVKYTNTVGYSPVDLYIDGVKQPDWDEAASLTVSNVQNLYVLRGTEAALYKASAVVLLELRRFDEKRLKELHKDGLRTTIGLLPLGYQRPKSFDTSPTLNPDREGTLYWNPCIRTDAAGRADVVLPERSDEGCYLRIFGQALDGRFFS
ncbi:MAG: hypothetical protein IJ636_05305, partial [Bacteroidales bacterium]|nr:hypothetical protein [Bacteroidales bacterium]